MAQSLQEQTGSPAYLDHFGMTLPPFAALPKPSPLFLAEQHSLLLAHLSDATRQADHILLLCGAQGSGKTTLLNQYISGLQDDVWFATLDDSCTNATRFYCALLEQLGFPEISGSLQELRNIAREFLLHRGKVSDNILLFIDNAHRLRPTIYAQLRWIADIRYQDRRVISVVLSGSPDLPEILGSEAMQSTCFANRTDFHIRKFSDEETDAYIKYRLDLAGGADATQFSPDAKPLIYSYSGGIPAIINTLCDNLLAEACAQGTRVISEDLVHGVAKAWNISQPSNTSINKGRRKYDVKRDQLENTQREKEETNQRTAHPADAGGNQNFHNGDTGLEPANDARQPPDSNGSRIQADRLIQDIVERDNKIGNLEEKLARSESECEMIRHELSSREEELSDLIEQLAQWDAALGTSLSGKHKREKEIETLRQQISTLTELNENEAVSGSGKVEEIRRELEESFEALKKARSEANKNSKELQKAQSAKKRVDDQLAKAKERIEELDQWRKELQESVHTLTNDRPHATKNEDHKAGLNEKIAAMEQDLQKKEKSNAEFERLLRQKDKRIDDLLKKLGSVAGGRTGMQQNLSNERKGADSVSADSAAGSGSRTKNSTRSISRLEVFRGAERVRTMKIADDMARIMVGRSSDCDLRLESNFVSRHHAIIFCDAKGARVEDLNSFNGTIVNSSPVSKCDLTPDEDIVVGDFLIRPKFS